MPRWRKPQATPSVIKIRPTNFTIKGDTDNTAFEITCNVAHQIYLMRVWFDRSWRYAFHPTGANMWLANKEILWHTALARGLAKMELELIVDANS